MTRIRFAETSQCLALQIPDPLAELFIRTQAMIKVFPVSAKRTAFCHRCFQSERIPEITVLAISSPANVHVTGFLADIDHSCSAHSHISFIQLNIHRLVSRYFISCLHHCPVPDCARLSGKIPQAERGRFLRKPVRAWPCSIQAGTGLPLQAEIKKRTCSIRLFYHLPSAESGVSDPDHWLSLPSLPQ